eukprot:SAG31_NODE_47826_length_214_cov_78.904348_1_plen_45_part_01
MCAHTHLTGILNPSARADWIATGWGTGYGRSRSDVHVLNLVLDSN